MAALLAPHVHISRPAEICAAMTLVVAQVNSYCSNAPVITNHCFSLRLICAIIAVSVPGASVHMLHEHQSDSMH